MPFCILANDILRATGYSKFTRLLFPRPNPLHLQALEINAPSLYQLLISKPNPLSIADFNDNKIDSIEYARSNKDAVFCSIFDMAQIKEACESYHLDFAQNIKILPGMKTCRILGSRKKKLSDGAVEEDKSVSYISRILNHPVVISESKKDPSDLRHEIENLQREVDKLKENLRTLLKSDLVTKLTMEIKKIKLEADSEHIDEMITRIKAAKNKRHEAYLAVQKCRSSISIHNQELYFKRMAMRYKIQIAKNQKDTSTSSKEDTFSKLTSETRGVFKANKCRLEKPLEDFVFSGTDNGIINMSTTTRFTSDRFKFHLKLYNRYQVLKETDVALEENKDKEYLNLPPAQVINSADIDVGTSHRKVRNKLERAKKHTAEGQDVSKVEVLLSKAPLTTTNVSVSEYQASLNLHFSHSAQLQKFYSSKKRANLKRAEEIQKSRFLDSMVEKERRQIVSKGGTIYI